MYGFPMFLLVEEIQASLAKQLFKNEIFMKNTAIRKIENFTLFMIILISIAIMEKHCGNFSKTQK